MPPRGNLFDELEQRFDQLRRDLLGHLTEPTLAPGMARAPAVDIEDQANQYAIVVELPGVRKEDIHLDIDENAVHVRAQTERSREEGGERKGYLRRERTSETYERSITLPEEVSPDGARATFRNGILHVIVPKTRPERRKQRRIEIE